jgi:8-oxo-dGTP diphosphatase
LRPESPQFDPRLPVLAVAAIVRQGNSLLMVRRGRAPSAGLWSVPGGRVEAGETLDEALRREVLEETGLEIEPGELLGYVERQDGDHFVILDFLASVAGAGVDGDEAVIRAGDDAAEVCFVPIGEVRDLPLVPGLGDFLIQHKIL